ncbi:MAG: HAMP domain-containing sensor histidine kinase [Bacillota bacterium]|jgi:signal transduction histidine kinase|uniref:HAMP domain-containing sensor histidine kinase n=1 Tax=Fictibacillus TaxID=1329200 RepID=UPI0018CFD8BD|nr:MULTISPECIES: HAMP domain-containing sensor histidine kinase [unclassified Fictibacillus]MBH0157193.1 HAMP domain-containing histidine kinase [Fictibacillus sp. 5RED26]MBH0159514.1 HAMP domain-containing histidine kinase [Fictibacillus sp. 26RED30]MBH0163686.1 HAMP domain-containing histidine kinase [Fictibacillus sp. 7GRE50]MBH0169687.1 HAMP domain-containing histidine kinase [Fictibacillus sp. 18YEL24]MBH0174187.1 HAMP domain-containing histidine kinase [Fictibacillus sp. 23RED33]
MKISIKLGLILLVIMLIIEFLLFLILYQGILTSRIQEETRDLVARGNNHRDVLERKFDDVTLHHVGLMESKAKTKVVVMDSDDNILVRSSDIDTKMKEILNKNITPSHHGFLVQNDWKKKAYFASVSPIVIDGKHVAFVYMFLDTKFIQQMNNHLIDEFVKISIISLIILIIAVSFLSKTITKPLLKMKEATKKLSDGYHKVTLDINRKDELGELALQITTLSEDLNRLQRDRIEFLANISHELRTPLTYITGYTKILQRPNIQVEEKAKYLTIINEESNNLTKLIEDLFELAKMDQTRFVIHKEKVSVSQLVQKVLNNIKPVFSSKKIELVYFSDGDYILEIDEKRIYQVLINLLDNAMKYSSENTTVNISVTGHKEFIEIQIKDEGEGIPENELPLIWDRLYRVEKSRSREKGGSGLGLAIVKEIIEQHDGKITATSQIGKGTTISVFLKRS